MGRVLYGQKGGETEGWEGYCMDRKAERRRGSECECTRVQGDATFGEGESGIVVCTACFVSPCFWISIVRMEKVCCKGTGGCVDRRNDDATAVDVEINPQRRRFGRSQLILSAAALAAVRTLLGYTYYYTQTTTSTTT